jgi:hypothetical protein
MSRVEYRYAENQIDRLPALVASGTVIVRGWAHEVSSRVRFKVMRRFANR